MSALYCFETARRAAAGRAQDADERHADAMERSEAKHAAEIHALFARGFAGEAVKLPDAFQSTYGEWVRKDITDFANAAQAASDNEDAFRVLLAACKARKEGRDADLGPLLDTFMSACADAYCAEHASDLAKAERDEEIANAWENKL